MGVGQVSIDDGAQVTASDLLQKIAKEDFGNVEGIVKFIKDGRKLDNASMQVLLFNLRKKYNMEYRDLLAVYLSLDLAVEKGALTNDVVDYLKKNPDAIKNFEGNTDAK